MTLVGYRKFVVTVLAQVCTTGLCAFGVLTGGEFVAGMIADNDHAAKGGSPRRHAHW